MKEVRSRLETHFLVGELTNAVVVCEKAAQEWLSRYSDCSPDLAAQIEAADLTLVKKKAADGAALLAKLLEAPDCDTALKARRDIREFYQGYVEMQAMEELGYHEIEAEALLREGSANLADLAAYTESFSGAPDEETLERVRETLARADEYLGEAYGIRLATGTNYPGFALGQYRYSKTATGYDVRGDIEWFKDGRVRKETSIKSPNLPFEVDPLPSTDDIRELKTVASDVAASPAKLGGAVVRKLSAIMATAGKPGFTEAQRKLTWFRGGGDSAYRMTQMMNMYLNTLRKLEMLPNSADMESIRSECRDLSLPIDIATVDGDEVDKKYSWLFIQDKLVASRNHECALFLKRQADHSLVERLKDYLAIAPGLKVMLSWNAQYAGVLGLEPVAGGTIVSPKCGEDAVALYALRLRGEKRVLVRVLVPNGGTWTMTDNAKVIGLSEGEPLFRFAVADEARDPENQLAQVLSNAPAEIRDEVIRVFHCE
jgi:hypothetical protein